ncbi:MAG: DNA polymerase Y family protein [Burkholderiaceae bacterium]|nr:DNA polymerase Y family protein [Burkholderiaceae bacterium]
MLWIALHLPHLSLQAFAATLTAELRQGPVALIDNHLVSDVNAAALRLGVKPGLKRNTALSLAPQLTLGEADARRDVQARQALVHAALAFTPSVTLEGLDVLLEVRASLRYFGGLPCLLQRLEQALQPLQSSVGEAQIASAPTALGAAYLARWRGDLQQGAHTEDPRALAQLLNRGPVTLLLGPAQARMGAHGDDLQGMGLRCIADLRQLPRAGLARRFGPQLLADLDSALGTRPDPRDWELLPKVFEQRLELFARADSTEQVLQGAALLLAQLVVWAQAGHGRVQCFELQMLHEARHRSDGPSHTVVEVALAQASADAAHLQLLLRERLGRATLAAPTLELRLRCSDLVLGAPPNEELFPTRQSQQEGMLRLIERLQARLGRERVLQLRPQADHRPECASRLSPWEPPTSQRRVEEALPSTCLTQPAWLLPEPQPLTERDACPVLEGQVLQLLSGPERIESGWWDGAGVARDYYIAMRPGGALVWVFRGRLALPVAGKHSGWFLQGKFA